MQYKGKKIRIVFLAFPEAVYGTTLESNDEYLVGINQGMAAITKRYTIGHELAHIYNDHFSSKRPIREIEREANKEAWTYYRLYKGGKLA